MNTILQKRIEEASIDYTMRTNPVCIAGDAFADMARELNKNPAFIAGANYVLQNQWISVEEALPEYNEVVLVHINEESGVGEMFSERTEKPFLVMIDENNFKIDYEDDHITHWMPIPKV